MTGKLEFYQETRDSGLVWLGRIPQHWSTLRAKWLFQCLDLRSSTGQEELLTVSSKRGIVPRSSETVTMFKAKSYVGHKLCWPKDLVINSLWAWGYGLGVSRYHGIISSAYGVYRLRKPYHEYAAYIHKLVRSVPFNLELRVRSKGIWISRLQLTDESFLDISMPLPEPEEQSAIVHFLDHIDRRVQRIICANQKMLRLLEELRDSIIHHTVTRGIDPNGRFKDANIEWLEMVPEHAVVTQVKRHYSIQLGKMLQNEPRSPYDFSTSYLKSKDVQWFNVRTIDAQEMWVSESDLDQFGVSFGDLLVCEGGEGGRCGLFQQRERGYIIQNALHRIRARRQNRNDYLQYVMRAIAVAGWFDALNDKATIAHFTKEKLGALRVPIPPAPVQARIASFLNRAIASIDAATESTQREISLIHEYHTRLVSDVVTGKLDVREAAAHRSGEGDHLESGEEAQTT